MNQLTCHIQQTNCGRTAGEPVCSKCGIDERVRYTTEEAVQFAKDQATAKYRQNEAIDTERLATQAEIEDAKSEEAPVQAQKEKQEAEAEAEDKLKGVFFVSSLS